jgi:hypothetical protein
MSFLDNIFGNSIDSQTVGQKVLTAYYNEASNFSEFTYPSYEAWMAFLVSRVDDIVTVIGDLVIGNSASTTIGEAENRVASLANQSGGQATIQEIVSAAGGRGDTVNWFEGAQDVISQTAQDAAQLAMDTAQNVGEGVISTTKLVKYLPWILGGAGVLYIYFNAKGFKLGR